jgi:hypothetical protein
VKNYSIIMLLLARSREKSPFFGFIQLLFLIDKLIRDLSLFTYLFIYLFIYFGGVGGGGGGGGVGVVYWTNSKDY